MPNITQTKGIVSAIANQLIGAQYFPAYVIAEDGREAVTQQLTAENIDAYNPTILSDIGKVVSAYTPARELVYNALIDQITKIVIDTKEFVLDLPDIYRDEDEFGMIREVVEIGISDFYDDPMWEDQHENNYGDPTRTSGAMSGHAVGKEYAQRIAEMRNATYLPKTRTKIYGKGQACMVAISIFRNQLFSAVRSWDEIDRIVSGMMISVRNALHAKSWTTAMGAIGMCIFEAFITGNGYNLLKEAHKLGLFSTITTAREALIDHDFQKFALEFMANTKDQMAAVNAYYNDHYLPTQTPKEDNRLILLAQWANRLKFGVRADTFHEELLGIGDYKKVPDWQGNNIATTMSGYYGNAGQMSDGNNAVTPYLWDAVSTVKLSLDSDARQALKDAGFSELNYGTYLDEDGVFEKKNVIGLMYDKWAIGMILTKENVFSDIQNPVDGKTNTFFHGLFNVAINSAKNKAVFYVDDDEYTGYEE